MRQYISSPGIAGLGSLNLLNAGAFGFPGNAAGISTAFPGQLIRTPAMPNLSGLVPGTIPGLGQLPGSIPGLGQSSAISGLGGLPGVFPGLGTLPNAIPSSFPKTIPELGTLSGYPLGGYGSLLGTIPSTNSLQIGIPGLGGLTNMAAGLGTMPGLTNSAGLPAGTGIALPGGISGLGSIPGTVSGFGTFPGSVTAFGGNNFTSCGILRCAGNHRC
ncbi:unnamed protein product [Thelazia callipaeda]|uniref:PPE family protein n=1 Tax=Thelazia callipaeda TaxID=103827 RepID=A0A0N5D567_THECL|nr:unnamed protein product [Thelazia callipaeda]